MFENIESNEDLSLAVKTALERKGVLKDIRAKIRAEVYHTLEDKTVTVSRPGIFNSSYSTSNGNIIITFIITIIIIIIIINRKRIWYRFIFSTRINKRIFGIITT